MQAAGGQRVVLRQHAGRHHALGYSKTHLPRIRGQFLQRARTLLRNRGHRVVREDRHRRHARRRQRIRHQETVSDATDYRDPRGATGPLVYR